MRRLLYFSLLVSLFMQPANARKTKLKKGLYTYGAEVNTFVPCGKNKDYWVVGNDKLMEELQKKHDSLTLKPYEPVYVEVHGTFEKKATEGFAADYDGQIRVFRLDSITGKIPNHCLRKKKTK